MRTHRLRRTLGLKLGLAFGGVLAVMLCSLAVVLVKSSAASRAYERAIAWRTALEGAADQAAGTRQQQASQALYVATGDKRYKREWDAGVEAAEKAGAAVEALHDPVVGRIANGATEADRKHDASVNKELFLRGRLATMIGEVAGSSQTVASASRQMAATSQEAGTAVGEIASAVGEVAMGAERQARTVETVRDTASEAAEVAA